MTRLEVDGNEYAYLDRGTGPLLLFGHGLSCDRHLFDAQIDSLRDRYRCVSLDWPGHGESAYRPDGWTLDDLASDTVAIVEQLGQPARALVGLSQGGMIFMRVAAMRPDLVGALILLDTSARPEPPERVELILANSRRMAAASDDERREFYRDFALPAFFTASWLEANPAAAARELDLRMAHDRTGYALAVAAVATRPPMHDVASAISAPTLVLVGELDSLTPPDHARELRELIPGARLEAIPGAGHHSPIEQPDLVTRCIAAFLDEVAATGL